MSKDLPTNEMTLCVCGQYHPVTECEVVVIRIVKGKNCNINSPRPADIAQIPGKQVFETSTKNQTDAQATQTSILPAAFKNIQAPKENPETPTTTIPPAEDFSTLKADKKTQRQPDQFARMFQGNFLPPDHPQAHKEIRRV